MKNIKALLKLWFNSDNYLFEAFGDTYETAILGSPHSEECGFLFL